MNNKLYDSIDMRQSYGRGFWIGAVSGVGSTFLMCLLVGMYYLS